jgi:hypothetical protein
VDEKWVPIACGFLGASVAVLACFWSVVPSSNRTKMAIVFISGVLTVACVIWLVLLGRHASSSGQQPWWAVVTGDNTKVHIGSWESHGKAPALLRMGNGGEATLDNIKTFEISPDQPLYRPQTTGAFADANLDFIMLSSRQIANRLLLWSSWNEDEQTRLKADAREIFGEIIGRLPPIRFRDVTTNYRAGYEAVCGLHGRDRVDQDYASNAAFYLIILAEDLRRRSSQQ